MTLIGIKEYDYFDLLTMKESYIENMYFLAPEVLINLAEYKSDVWSIGILTYVLATA